VYRTGIQEYWGAEPPAALAFFENEKLVVCAATQWASHVKRSLSLVLARPLETIEVIPTKTGMSLDGKIWYPSLIACQAALGTVVTGKPVRLCLTRADSFRYSPKRNKTEVFIASMFGENNEHLGTEIKVTADLGASGVFTDEIVDRTCLGSLGAYTVAPVKIEGRAIKTNVPPQGPFEGYGLSQGFFAAERHIARVADVLHVAPTEWRRQRFFRKNDSLAIGVPLKEIYLEQVMDAVSAMCDYDRRWASYELLRNRRHDKGDTPLRGIGIALAYQGSGFLYSADKGGYAVEATLGREGLEIKTSAVPSDETSLAIIRNIAAKILSIEAEAVNVIADDTIDAGPLSNSRSAIIITLIERCCSSLKKQRHNIPATARCAYKPAKAQRWGGMPDQGGRDQGKGKTIDQNALSHISWGAAVAEIEIERKTFIPKIRGLWLCIEGGRILSESRAQYAVKTAAAQALGWASRELLAYDEGDRGNGGHIGDSAIYNYDILSPADIPNISVKFLETGASAPKGIGELPFSTIPAAYVQAVSQALDHPFEKIPLTAKDMWEAEEEGNR
jgi:CO/xanthine dehydrogenase Mo-binding subunit